MQNPRAQALKSYVLSLIFLIGLQTAPVLAQTAPAAQPKPDVESILSSKKVTVGADKKEALADAKDVKPGDTLEYQAAYNNKGKAGVSNLIATLPIPDGTEYIKGSLRPAFPVKATTGDGRFEPIPLKRKVKTPDGKEVEQEVPTAQYKALQWNLGDLPAGKSATVAARVRISEAPITAPAAASSSAPAATPASGGAK